jgi:hypothetical protein
MRNTAPPNVRRRLAPFPRSWEPESGNFLLDQMVASLLPVKAPPAPTHAPLSRDALPLVLHELPQIPSHPWLSLPLIARLQYELQSIDLFPNGDPEYEGAPDGELDGEDEETDALNLRARAEAVQAPLAELQAEILRNLPRWTEQRNERLATIAAMRKNP